MYDYTKMFDGIVSTVNCAVSKIMDNRATVVDILLYDRQHNNISIPPERIADIMAWDVDASTVVAGYLHDDLNMAMLYTVLDGMNMIEETYAEYVK